MGTPSGATVGAHRVRGTYHQHGEPGHPLAVSRVGHLLPLLCLKDTLHSTLAPARPELL